MAIPNDFINLGKIDLVKLAQAAYALSVPQGLGFLHVKDGPLSEADAKRHMKEGEPALSMDYVYGRACKFNVWRDSETGNYYTKARWYDHSDEQLKSLLEQFGITVEKPAQ